MNALLKKEIRLLLPVWLTVLALEIVLPWFGSERSQVAPVFLFFGMILLAVDSFGREFSLGTFSSLMAQPIERQRIWRTKIAVLFAAAVLIFAAYFASCGLRLHLALTDNFSQWRAIEIKAWKTELFSNFHQNMTISTAIMFVALTGGLWTTLLFRQIAAAFWITFLAPAGLVMATLFFLPSSLASKEHLLSAVLYSLAGLYVVWSFWLAHRQFHRAQDAGWTGGVIAFSKWRYFESGSRASDSTRHRKPLTALIKKELQLQSISWFCAAALLVLHLAVISMRYVHGSFERDSVASVTSEFFWAVWLILPLIIGSTAVAEERRLGVTEGQFCQPASRRLQFVLKYFPAIFSGLLLGGLMPLLLEGIAAAIGAPNPDFGIFMHTDNSGYVSPVVVLGLALGLSLAAFYASTLSKSFMQAMGIAVVTIIGCCLFTAIARGLRSLLGIDWNPVLTIGISILTVLVMAPALSYGNSKYTEEHGRIWRRNFFGLVGAIVFILISSAALYNRAWEVFEPTEPAHGQANFSLANPPTLQHRPWDNFQVQLPDGQIWSDYLNENDYPSKPGFWQQLRRLFASPLPKSMGQPGLIAGSNWLSVAASPNGWNGYNQGSFTRVGVQQDGTLCLSSNSKRGNRFDKKIIRLDDGNNWRQAVLSPAGILLLKGNGTLWRWADFSWNQQLSPANFKLLPVSSDADWTELYPAWPGYAKKSDGSVWEVHLNKGDQELQRETNLEQTVFNTLSLGNGGEAFVRPDGTLQFGGWRLIGGPKKHEMKFSFTQIGMETNWEAVAVCDRIMVGLKSDGSLWQWKLPQEFVSKLAHSPSARLSIHSDWVAISATRGGVVALAADGSLWFWPDRNSYEYYRQSTMLKLPKQPQFLGNVLSGAKR